MTDGNAHDQASSRSRWLYKSGELKVRLAGTDAPERRQAFGRKAKETLSALVFGRTVRVVEVDRDRYGRLVGRVYRGNLDVNAEMVRRGMAWVYRKYTRDRELYRLEDDARAARRGLWADAHPVPPWEYRRKQRLENGAHALRSEAVPSGAGRAAEAAREGLYARSDGQRCRSDCHTTLWYRYQDTPGVFREPSRFFTAVVRCGGTGGDPAGPG